jgi:hypothetical protein
MVNCLTTNNLWSILTDKGVPMQEATLCLAHMDDADACTIEAKSAEDYSGGGWVAISAERARSNGVDCSTCRAIHYIGME